jgi:hypothetical protein
MEKRMFKLRKSRSAFMAAWGGLVLLSLAMLASACVVSGPSPAPSSQAGPTYFLTQFVTQVVATAPTPTPEPTLTKTPWPTPTLEWDPYSAPVSYPLTGCTGSRLHLGGMAFVAITDAVARLYFPYSPPTIEDNPGIRSLQVGEIMHITGGPWCENKLLIWQVYMLSDKKEGLVVEGDGNTYWILPMSPKEPTPRH